jgi:hypothetical protein
MSKLVKIKRVQPQLRKFVIKLRKTDQTHDQIQNRSSDQNQDQGQHKKIIILKKKQSQNTCISNNKDKVLIVTKNNINQICPMVEEQPKLKCVPHGLIDLPSVLHLKPFEYQNQHWLIDNDSGYIFIPNDIKCNKIEPMGQLVTCPVSPTSESDNVKGVLPNQFINWFYRYDFGDEVIS